MNGKRTQRWQSNRWRIMRRGGAISKSMIWSISLKSLNHTISRCRLLPKQDASGKEKWPLDDEKTCKSGLRGVYSGTALAIPLARLVRYKQIPPRSPNRLCTTSRLLWLVSLTTLVRTLRSYKRLSSVTKMLLGLIRLPPCLSEIIWLYMPFHPSSAYIHSFRR